MALGAQPRTILWATVAHASKLALWSGAAGIALALGLTLYRVPHEHSGLIYGVGVHDPASFAGIMPGSRRRGWIRWLRSGRIEGGGFKITDRKCRASADHDQNPQEGCRGCESPTRWSVIPIRSKPAPAQSLPGWLMLDQLSRVDRNTKDKQRSHALGGRSCSSSVQGTVAPLYSSSSRMGTEISGWTAHARHEPGRARSGVQTQARPRPRARTQ
jgi:hypothetical protein